MPPHIRPAANHTPVQSEPPNSLPTAINKPGPGGRNEEYVGDCKLWNVSKCSANGCGGFASRPCRNVSASRMLENSSCIAAAGRRVHGRSAARINIGTSAATATASCFRCAIAFDRPCDGSTRPFPSRSPESVDRSGNEGHRDKFHHYDRVVEPQAVENDR